MADHPTEQAGARKWRIAQRLRESRQQQSPKLSQAALARRVNESGLPYFQTTHASRLECGYMDATWDEVETLARILGVTSAWLASRPIHAGVASQPPADPPRNGVPAPNGPTSAAAPRGMAAAAASETPPPAAGAVDEAFPLPDVSLLEQGGRPPYVFRQSLVDALAHATAMLHRPGLPARSWRAWRDFDRQVRELLRQVPTD